MRRNGLISGAVAGVVGVGWWARTHPAPLTYRLRWVLDVPRPGLTSGRLAEALAPRAEEVVVEIGPGTGHFTVSVAQAIGPGGELHAVDVQPEMLDVVARKTRAAGLDNVRIHVADARQLPLETESADALFMVTVLGEVPDQAAALREAARVLKPGGRLVIGEIALLDPHWVSLTSAQECAADAGLRYEKLVGSARFAYFARFRR